MSEIPSDRTEARSALRELGTFNDPVDIRNYYRGNNTNLTKDDREQLDRIAELLPAEEIARKLDQPQLAETIEGSRGRHPPIEPLSPATQAVAIRSVWK